ncbi:DUF4238 domain-containing protein [Sphingomonas sp.]|uniref:DUF4238 domain-containing protein n=1 Tax=Sphingomonas sp. TaxID=28214 RepID=UPI003B000600
MADNRNQHYVPRVHLKPFTRDGAGRAINLFNLERTRAISDVPAKNQCSGDYFYGHDARLERAIQSVEGPYGSVVRHLAENGVVAPGVDIVLRRFLYLQFLRTEAAAIAGAEMAMAMTAVPGSDLPAPSFGKLAKMAVQAAMQEYAATMCIVDDLKLSIVRDRTGLPFVTSDNPAILTNRLHFQRPVPGKCSFGAKDAGVVFLLPLTPALLAILYDGNVYAVAHRGHWVDADRTTDIAALNQHQYLHCMANIYFGDWECRVDVGAAAADARPRRPAERLSVVHAVRDEISDWGERFTVQPITDIRDGRKWLINVWPDHPEPAAWPSFLRFRPGATAWSNDTGAGRTRQGSLEHGFVTGAGYRKIRV